MAVDESSGGTVDVDDEYERYWQGKEIISWQDLLALTSDAEAAA